MITKYAGLLKKTPAWIYKIAAQSWIDYRFPRHLFLETTASCNLQCDYCPREKINKHMDWGIFQQAIDEASQFGPRSFSLHLFGEPLLYPRIIEACSYIKRKNPRHVILLTTNGTILERFIDRLIDCGVDKVLWSWRREVKWSNRFKERLKKWPAFTVRIIRELTPPGQYQEWHKWPHVEERNLHNYGGEIDIGHWQKSTAKSEQQEKRWPCYHLWLAPAVAWNGNILLCCADPHQKEVLGTFPDQKISEIWQGERISKIRKSHLKGDYSGVCKNCDVWRQYPDLFFGFQKS